ncbi:LpsA protein [Arcticibacter svalbardensis MN12-7]|uniref:LpsA protein n=1 Tax=Arcticibacter svalbardensis MN12-7 TaxID=1150600 RepID=R9GQ55_9SPHI|nr:glycosyl transferase family 90 [Arcticibacter svalbardensis]EOR93972.1 LpsA protein [Arcticibacter svalbardensis MN12-7]
MFLQEVYLKIRKNKFLYYAKNFLRQVTPTIFYENSLSEKLSSIHKFDIVYLTDRVNYYNKLKDFTPLGIHSTPLKQLLAIKSPKAYRFDTYEYTRYFKKSFLANFLFGDIITIPKVPTIQKSRPIAGDNAKAIVLNLDKKRHFFFIHDHKKLEEKTNTLIGRAVITQPHRISFMKMYFNHPMCDIGQVNKKGGNPEWLKPKMSIIAHLNYKFILSLEGNDVATNLKWIMSSNSIAVMRKPVYETWFMEGRLIPDFHYILIKDDYSDLEERLNFYINHPEEAQIIVNNAHQYIKQFLNSKQEDLISLLVLEKYFYYTSQIKELSL